MTPGNGDRRTGGRDDAERLVAEALHRAVHTVAPTPDLRTRVRDRVGHPNGAFVSAPPDAPSLEVRTRRATQRSGRSKQGAADVARRRRRRVILTAAAVTLLAGAVASAVVGDVGRPGEDAREPDRCAVPWANRSD
ncbi:MAG: hypothetical protein ACK5OX_00990 [Desertimonas sp.]